MTDEQAELDYTTTPPKLTQKGELEAAANRYRNGLYGGIVLPGTGMDRDAELLAREYCRIEPNVELHQAQIDRLQSQILTLRLIADRAATLLLTGSTPDLAHMTQEQGEAIAAYTSTSDYGDMAEVESAEQALIDLVVKPLNQMAAGERDTIDLLKMAMREIERDGIIREELDQCMELMKLRPDLNSLAMFAASATRFALKAGKMPKDQLLQLYSPCVALALIPRPQ